MPILTQIKMSDRTFIDKVRIACRQERALPIFTKTVFDSAQVIPNRAEYEQVLVTCKAGSVEIPDITWLVPDHLDGCGGEFLR